MRPTVFGNGVGQVPDVMTGTVRNAAQKAVNIVKSLGQAYAVSDAIKFNPYPKPGEGYVAPNDQQGLKNWTDVRNIQQENLKDPLLSWTQKVPEWSTKQWPMPPGVENNLAVKLGGAIGGFGPVLASGPFAPLTIGMETLGDVSEHAYNDKIAQGIEPERAAREAYGKAVAGAGTQAALWYALPKPLRFGANAIIDKLGFEGAKRFFLNRVMQGIEGAALGAGTQIPTNIAMGDPAMQDVAQTAGGIGALQAVLPRGYTPKEVKALKLERQQNLSARQALLGRPSQGATTRYDEKGDATGKAQPELQGPEIPADLDEQLAAGTIWGYEDKDGTPHYFKNEKGGEADATTKGKEQKDTGEKLPRTEAQQNVSTDTGEGGAKQGQPADDSDSTTGTPQEQVRHIAQRQPDGSWAVITPGGSNVGKYNTEEDAKRTAGEMDDAMAETSTAPTPFFVTKENGVWIIGEKNEKGEILPGVDHGRFSGDTGQARAQAQADYLNKKIQEDYNARAAADIAGAEEPKEKADEAAAVGPEIMVLPKDADGNYPVVDKRLPKGSPPIFMARTLEEAHKKKEEETSKQNAAHGQYEIDTGMGSALVYDIPTQNELKRLKAYADLRDAGGEITPSMKSLMEDDTKSLQSKGIDLSQFDPRKPESAVVPQVNPPPEQAAPAAQVTPGRMSDANKAEINKIREDVADAQNVVRAYTQNPPITPEDHFKFGQAQDEVRKAWNKIHQIREATGKRRELVIIGKGAAGTQLATYDGYEGGDPVMVAPGHSQAYHSREIVNTGSKREGVTGKSYFGEKEMSAEIAGAQSINGEVVDLKYANGKDGSDGVDVYVGVRTGKGPKDYKVTQVIPAWEVAIATGSTGIKIPYPGHELTGWGSSDELIKNSRGGKGLVYGRGNAATQAILSALGEKDRNGNFVIPEIISLSRSDFFKNSEASDDQLQRLKAYARPSEQFPNGRVQFVTGVLDKPGGVTQNPDGTLKVKITGSKANPTANYTFNVKAVENFLASKNNTAWATGIPELQTTPVMRENAQGQLVPELDPITKQPLPPSIKVIAPGSHRTTMENVFVMGDVRETLPGEKRGRRIRTAEGDASDVAVDVQERTALRRNGEPIDPWETQKPEGAPIDKRLKEILKQTTPEDTPHGSGLYEAPPRYWDAGTSTFGRKVVTAGGDEVYISGTTGEPALTGGKTVDPQKPLKHKRQVRLGEAGTTLFTNPQGQNQQDNPPTVRGRFITEDTPPVDTGQQNQPAAPLRPGGVMQDVTQPNPFSNFIRSGETPRGMHEGAIEGGLHTEYPEIGRHMDRYIMDNDPRGIQDALRDPRYGEYHQDLTRLLRRAYGDEIPVARVEGYAGGEPVEGRGANYVSVSTNPDWGSASGKRGLPVWRGTVRPEDVALAGHEAEGELIVKRSDLATDYGTRDQIEGKARERTAQNPYYPDRLVSELNAGTRNQLDPIEEQALVDRRDTLTRARDRAGKIALNGKMTPGERASAATDFEKADAGIRQLEHATDEGGKINTRDNKLKWHSFRQKDYDVPAMEQKLSIAKHGEPVTPKETADLTRKVATLARKQANLDREKIKTAWRPGQGKGGDVGQVRQKQHEVLLAKQALDDTVFAQVLKHKNFMQKAARLYRNTAGLSRAIMTADFTSALLRQGGLLFSSHPLRSLGIMKDTFKASKSDFEYFRLMQDIRERPNAPLYDQSKLGLTDIRSPKISQLEEAYMSPWVDKIPGLNHSQRAYVYFLNRLRADTFDSLATNLGQKQLVTLEQAKGISNFINVFTGRGRIKEEYAGGIAALNELFFAPRYVLSRFQALTLQPLRYAKDPAVRKAIVWEYARTLVGYSIIYGLINMLGKQAGVTIEKNPLSTDFGKVKIGNTRIDLLAGVAQTLTVMSRFGFVATKTAQGQTVSLKQGPNVPFTRRNLPGVVSDFVRTKLAPVPSAILNAQSGQKVTGEPAQWLGIHGELAGLVTPLNGGDILNAMVAQGVAPGLALAVLTNFGASVNTYSAKFKGRSPKQHRARH
jgi:thioredoxin reductase